MTTAETKRIVLWGTTHVGKTALLATALYGGDPDLTGVIRNTAEGSIHTGLFDTWVRLRTNRWVEATSAAETSIVLSSESGTRIELVDIRGGRSLEMQEAPVREMLRASDAILFFMEYDPSDSGRQIAAVEAAMIETAGRPWALALTKCERWLKCDDEAWRAKPGWLTFSPLWRNHSSVLEPLAQMAWPTSAFGYTEDSGLPATIIGEMGQTLPFRIQPRNVGKPLAALLRALGCI